MANGKISGDPQASTTTGLSMAAVQGGANVQAPSTLFAATQSNLADLSDPAAALANLGGQPITVAAPIVILSTGQSNAALHPAYAWTPSPNLYLWGWDGLVDLANVTGTAFAAMPATSMGFDYAYANEVAKANPLAKVYLIKIGMGSQAIAQWKVGAAPATLDMYAACKNNTQAALTLLGLSKIDRFLWWQGESDAIAVSATYQADFETVIARFRAETWFPLSAPITIMGLSEYYIAPVPAFNATMATVASVEPDIRTFVRTSTVPQAMWDIASSYIHMLAAGYEQAGKLAYLASRANAQGVTVDPYTGFVGIGQVPSTYKLSVTHSLNGIAGNLVYNPNAGAAASAWHISQSNAGLLGMYVNSTAGGGTGALIGTFPNGFSLYMAGPIRFVSNGIDAGGVSTAGNWDVTAGKTLTVGGLIDASGAAAGQIKFPATQNASADPNTFDDYKEGTWTPVLTFTTPGTLSITSVATGSYTKKGREVTLHFAIQTSAVTLGTASGSLTVTGSPFTNSASGVRFGSLSWDGITKASYTQINSRMVASSNLITFLATGSGQVRSQVVVADVTPAAGVMTINGTIIFEV